MRTAAKALGKVLWVVVVSSVDLGRAVRKSHSPSSVLPPEGGGTCKSAGAHGICYSYEKKLFFDENMN